MSYNLKEALDNAVALHIVISLLAYNVSAEDISDIIGVTPKTLKKWLKTGNINFKRQKLTTRNILYSIDNVLDYLRIILGYDRDKVKRYINSEFITKIKTIEGLGRVEANLKRLVDFNNEEQHA